MGVIDPETLSAYVVVGELGLDGRVAPSPGVLLAAIHAGGAGRGLICTAAQGSEAAWAGHVEVIGAPDLLALLGHFKRSEEQTSELQSIMRIPYAVFCMIQKNKIQR